MSMSQALTEQRVLILVVIANNSPHDQLVMLLSGVPHDAFDVEILRVILPATTNVLYSGTRLDWEYNNASTYSASTVFR